ncbi:BamA/TamA family outer membrane protein [Pedobacter sp. 22163]|uniref:BamA/TamA family outer membrane protein n=1 Tax=Pedobacter sp. 22163 TaxID=3453883 RepID=UPI003F876A0A
MIRQHIFFTLAFLLATPTLKGQNQKLDSVIIIPVAKYDSVSRLHRQVFGENYRKDYARPVKVPVIRLSEIAGGLTAIQAGGGNQSKTLRLIDAAGKEWTLRSVKKFPAVLLPLPLRETFLLDILEDNMSAQYPFGALVVPVLAQAVGIPHTNPLIGVVEGDIGLGIFAKDFVNTLCLLEEREPLGESDNTAKMLKQVANSNRYRVDWQTYLKAKALDVLLGDWDRHEDQWRWAMEEKTDRIQYIPVPRDRDQVFYRSDGIVQRLAQSSWLLPMMQGYERDIRNINWFLWEGRNLNSQIFSGVSQLEWKNTIKEFCAVVTDSLLSQALLKLPDPTDPGIKAQILTQMRKRRDALPDLMDQYYLFLNKTVDVPLSDQDEIVSLVEKGNGYMQLDISRAGGGKAGSKLILQRELDPAITKELRIFLRAGNDSVFMESLNSKIKVRLVGGEDIKDVKLKWKGKPLIYYGKPQDRIDSFHNKLRTKLSADTANFTYYATNLYSRKLTLANVGFNVDDGAMVGISHRFTAPGFRKHPFASIHSLSALYAWNTSAFSLHYLGEWMNSIGNHDILIDLEVNAPNNTRNYFGSGNESVFDRESSPLSFYRARFNLYTFKALIRNRWGANNVAFGPLFQNFHYSGSKNIGKFIERYLAGDNSGIQVSQNSFQAGAVLQLMIDNRDKVVLTQSGILLKSSLELLTGLGQNARRIGVVNSEFTFFFKLNEKGSMVFSNRLGGGFSAGKPEFFQLPYLGGTDNLTGYRKFRFAGDYSAFNNAEIRIRIGSFLNYILPGEFGFNAMHDFGRVWKRGEHSERVHHGFGAGLYFAPASYARINLTAGYSKEGFYPTLTLKSQL